jgi:hypothetical protein
MNQFDVNKQRRKRSTVLPAHPGTRLYGVLICDDGEVWCWELPLLGWLYDPDGDEMKPLTPNGAEEAELDQDGYELVVVTESGTATIVMDNTYPSLKEAQEAVLDRSRRRPQNALAPSDAWR